MYRLLKENDLCTYYELDEQPGITLGEKVLESRYEYLDNPEIIRQLIDFSENGISRITLLVPQMHCTSCIWLLENLQKLNPGIIRSQANFLQRQVTITYHEKATNLKQLVVLLTSIGYEPAIRFSDLEKRTAGRYSRKIIYQLGLAGFAFGNMMLLSFPAYLGLGNPDQEFARLFSWLNVGFSLPVLLYSAQDYFRSAWYGLRQRMLNIDVPISIGILALFTRSLYEIITASGPGYLDSMAGLVFFLLIGKWIQQRTYNAIAFDKDYRSYFPVDALKRENGQEKPVPISNLKSGDLVIIRHKELIPADGTLIKGEALIDYSFVTGESEPVIKKPGDTLYAGGRQAGAAIEIRLSKTVSESYLAQLWNAYDLSKAREPRAAWLADRISRYFTPVILLISLAAALAWLPAGLSRSVYIASAVLIVACPCALALSVPFTLGNAMRLLGLNRLYLRNPSVLEYLGKVTHIVFDKTGTLTSSTEQQLRWTGPELAAEDRKAIKALTRHSAHPVSRKIYESLSMEGSTAEVENFHEIPGQGIEGMINGKLYRIGRYAFVNQQDHPEKNPPGTWLAVGGKVHGHWQMKHSFRPGVKKLIRQLTKRYRFSVITGDDDKEKKFLQEIFPSGTSIHFRMKPVDKVRFIQSLQKEGEKVLMLGDGLNDAGALSEAWVGFAVSEDINHFSPACDGILESGSFTLLPGFLQYGRKAVKIVYTAFGISFLYNLTGIALAVQGLLTPLLAAVLMPISSLTVVLFSVGASGLTAKWTGLSKSSSENYVI